MMASGETSLKASHWKLILLLQLGFVHVMNLVDIVTMDLKDHAVVDRHQRNPIMIDLVKNWIFTVGFLHHLD
jgi:hypothetical protein